MNYDEKLKEATVQMEELATIPPLPRETAQQQATATRIEHVWSSNAIEGSRLTRAETAEVLESGMTVPRRPIADILAAVDLASAYDYMLDLAAQKQPLTEATIRDFNRLVMIKNTPVAAQAGAYRTIAVWPAGRPDHPYVNPLEVPVEIAKLVDWTKRASRTLHPIQYAADLHYHFVSIHPFTDGNGRTARLLMNLVLVQAGYPVVSIQPDELSRTRYLEALVRGQDHGDLAPFENLIADYVLATLGRRCQDQMAEPE